MKVDLPTERASITSAVAAKPDRPPPALKPAAPPAPPSQPSASQVDVAIEAANRSMQAVATNLKFEKDNTSGKIVVRVIDSETQQVLRQMPSEEMLSMSKALDSLKGLMVHLKV